MIMNYAEISIYFDIKIIIHKKKADSIKSSKCFGIYYDKFSIIHEASQ